MTYQGLRFFDMLMSEKELPIEITQVNRIKIDDMDFAEASKDQIFQ